MHTLVFLGTGGLLSGAALAVLAHQHHPLGAAANAPSLRLFVVIAGAILLLLGLFN
ncbi:hypothetical protein MF271_19325 (plasmid) [Deinococcus sp. KNUC1210]|uniref:hypothetical protein n=1 Tax=Deinococcus sp. KNUC1210 TaxID=2917691 RepID=UPI001EEFFB52|nr:hypothetical protein [Deinococcus sp. KNUC1210]ULH17343.1 hypothetical protein MF271_19325 [Deinococcus sp. KNUC1210]